MEQSWKPATDDTLLPLSLNITFITLLFYPSLRLFLQRMIQLFLFKRIAHPILKIPVIFVKIYKFFKVFIYWCSQQD